MELNQWIHILIANRFMKTEREIILFEEALEKTGETNNHRIVGKLVDGLEDDTEHEEVMWRLIHTIEYLGVFSPKESLVELVKAVPNNIGKGREWIEILHYRILNHNEYRILFAKALKEVDGQVQKIIISLFNDIAEEKPAQFKNKVEEVITVLLK